MDVYAYDELTGAGSFRIVFLGPGQGDDELHCRLEAHDTASVPKYEALSYVWGDPTRTIPVRSEGKSILATPALVAALRALRLADRERVLWVDQICINQDDLDERTQQVQLMKGIYSTATRVLLWLGTDDGKRAPGAKEVIKRIDLVWNKDIGSVRFPTNAVLQEQGLPLRDAPCWVDLEHMLENPYFQRVWTVQECRTASEILIVWGTEEFSWIEFYHTYHWIAINSGAVPEAAYGSEPATARLNIHSEILFSFRNTRDPQVDNNLDWLELLKGTRMNKAGDPRDKLYGLIGLFQETGGPLLKPDYRKPSSQVFAELVIEMIPRMRSLRILSFAPLAKNDQFPLWAPRWEWDLDGEITYKPFEHYIFDASGGTRPMMRESPAWDILVLKGLTIDEIEVTTSPLAVGPKVAGTLVMDAWELLNSKKPIVEARYPEPHGVMVAFAWTLTAGQSLYHEYLMYKAAENEHLLDFAANQVETLARNMEDADKQELVLTEQNCQRTIMDLAFQARRAYQELEGTPAPSGDNTDQMRDWMHDFMLEAHSNSTELADHVLDKVEEAGFDAAATVRYETMLACVAFFRKFFVSKQGYVGLAAHGVQPGDKICVLFGGATPYILRPTDVPGKYLFKGECYVHGLMNGEAIDLWDDGKLDSQWFNLR